ncbi:MAG: hypothetical protein IPK88_12450 [Saprospiraceae bacterium]|nr:hypothetical protein [Candidatus Defluviibacterium haderslevense]
MKFIFYFTFLLLHSKIFCQDIDYAFKLFQEGKYQAAIFECDKILLVSPSNDEILYWRGYCKANTGDFYGAISDLNRAIQLNDFSKYFSIRGFSKEKLGIWKDAISDYNVYLKEFPNDLNHLDSRALCYLKLHEDKLALNDYDRILILDSSNNSALFWKGFILLNNRIIDEGCKYLFKAKQLGYVDQFKTLEKYCPK